MTSLSTVLGTALCAALSVPVLSAQAPSSTNPAPLLDPVSTPSALTQTWSFDETTTGQDIVYTSPTSVQPNALQFTSDYAITTVEVSVSFSGLPFGPFDVTDQIPPEFQVGVGSAPGPAPFTLLDDALVFPDPPEPPSISADVFVGLDASGFGSFTASNVVLGTIDIDLPIFGTVTATITSVRIAGDLTVTSLQFLDLGLGLAGTGVAPTLAGDGELLGNDPMSLTLQGALPGSTAALVVGFTRIDAPFKGGVLVPAADLLITGLPVNGIGVLVIPATWPVGIPPDFQIFFQMWITDAGGPNGFSASNGLMSETP